MSYLTSRLSASGASLTDIIHIVITGDTTQNLAGSSYKIDMGSYIPLFSGLSTTYWSGGTGIGSVATTNGDNIANANYSLAEGNQTTASGIASHSEGSNTIASNISAHAEGNATQANGFVSHAEGNQTLANGSYSHAEGNATQAIGNYSHAEGSLTNANNSGAHAGGYITTANGLNSFVHGSASTASGINTIVLGAGITGLTDNSTYVDRFNIKTFSSGTSINNLGVDSNGNVVIGINIYVTGSTFNNSNYDLTIWRNDGTQIISNLGILASDMTITGGTYNPSNGTATFTNNSGNTFNVTGFITGFTDTFVTGGTYTAGTTTLNSNTGGTITITGYTDAPFESIDEGSGASGIIVRGRDATQFGPIGPYAFDFSDANLGAFGDVFGQVGQIGVNPLELYGALGEATYAFGWNVSAEGYASSIFGFYNHVGVNGTSSTILGRNNYLNSSSSLISGSFNIDTYTYLGNKTIFGNGNVVKGSATLTAGAALINKSFGTTVLGQANLDYTDTASDYTNMTLPVLIVGNGTMTSSAGIWYAGIRSNAFVLLKNGLATLPSVTNDLISAEPTGKVIVTKEYLTGYTSGFTSSNLQKTITSSYTATSVDNNYTIFIDNSATTVTITVPSGLTSNIEIGFIQQGTGDINYLASGTILKSPSSMLKIKGENYNAYLVQIGSTNTYHLLGNLKA